MSKKLATILALHSSPAICGIKASNLICIEYNESLFNEIEELNLEFNPKIYFKILKRTNNHVLILVYKKEVLDNHLKRNDVRHFLLENGYNINTTDDMLKTLIKRFEDIDFPHEIGVFLGYDIQDIKDFLKGDKECIYVGYWKVYSNLDKKINTFNRFTRCRNHVLGLINKGYPLEKLLR